MQKFIFIIGDFLCNFIPGATRRASFRTNRLYDWRKKYNALRAAYPEWDFRHVSMIRGGWNIGFIVNRKYVFKVRKHSDDNRRDKIIREKRITDAMAKFVSVRIPHIEFVNAGEYTFYKYDFIPGKNLNLTAFRKIKRNREKLGRQLAEFIYALHNANAPELEDLKPATGGDGWSHNDICNNILVNRRTMDIVGIIDWEHACWGDLAGEIKNTTRYSPKMRKSGIQQIVAREYDKLAAQNANGK